METQGQSLSHLDLLFIVLNLVVTACCVWNSSGMAALGSCNWWQRAAAAWGHCLLLPLAAVWLMAAPSSYGRWREPLWVAHKVLSALHMGGMLLLGGMLQRRMASAGAAVAAGALGLHKGKALSLMAANLGLKVKKPVLQCSR